MVPKPFYLVLSISFILASKYPNECYLYQPQIEIQLYFTLDWQVKNNKLYTYIYIHNYYHYVHYQCIYI